MDFSQMTDLALIVRQQYANIEKKKYGKSWTTEQLALGFMGDMGELAKLMQAHAGFRQSKNLDAKISHELADCLWSIIVLAKELNIDLEQAFIQTMNELHQSNNASLEKLYEVA